MHVESSMEKRSDTEITRANLTSALETIGDSLFRADIVTVGASVESTFKDIPEGIEINLDPTLQSNDEIKLGFWNGKSRQVAEIIINGSQDEENHLSGPATPEVFIQRITAKLAEAGITLN